MNTFELEIYESLKKKLGIKETQHLLELIESRATKEVDAKGLATKVELEMVKADIIKWMFIFWVSQLGVIFAMFKIL